MATLVALTILVSGVAPAAPQISNSPSPTAGQPTVEQFNQCLDPYSSLDQTIKRCTTVIEWMTTTASALGNPSRDNYPVAQALFYKYRASAYYQKGQYDLAIADFTEAIHLQPTDGDLYYNRGQAYDDKHDYERAISDFTKASMTASTKTAASAATSVGHVYMETHKYNSALYW